MGIDEAGIHGEARQVPHPGAGRGLVAALHPLDDPVADDDGRIVHDLSRSRHHTGTDQGVITGAVVPDAVNGLGTVGLLSRGSARNEQSE